MSKDTVKTLFVSDEGVITLVEERPAPNPVGTSTFTPVADDDDNDCIVKGED